jgi:hypothetical protein
MVEMRFIRTCISLPGNKKADVLAVTQEVLQIIPLPEILNVTFNSMVHTVRHFDTGGLTR